MPDTLRLEFTITPDDTQAAVALMNKRRTSRAFLGWLLILSFAVLIFVLFHGEQTAPPGTPTATPRVHTKPSILDVFFNFMPYIVIFLVLWFVFYRSLRRKKNQPELETQTVTFSTAGVTWETHDSRTENKWTVYKRFLENKNLFVLLLNEKLGVPIPKRAMTPDQIAQLRSLFQSHIGTTGGFPVIPAK